MSLLGSIGGMLEREALQRLSAGAGNFNEPGSQDHQVMQQMVSQASPTQLNQAFSGLGQQMDPQSYAQHLGGGSALAGLGGPALGTLASLLVSHLTNNGQYSSANLAQSVPGLTTADPRQMNPQQVAALAQYTQQNHPDIFSSVAAQLGQQQPGLLNSFLGKAGMALGAAALASHFVKVG